MDRVPTPAGFTMPVHIVLGLADDHPDIDQPWGGDLKRPVSPDNPPRGFHAGAAMMDAIWADEGRTDITVDSVAHTMGRALGTCVRGGIIPLDIEFIYGGDRWVSDPPLSDAASGIYDPPPAPAPSLIDYKNKPRAERKTIKESLKWRKARAKHAKQIAKIEHDLLNNNNADDDMCHIMRIIAAVNNYTYKKPDTPFNLSAYIINKYKRALSESDYNMLREFNNYLHQKLTEPPSTN